MKGITGWVAEVWFNALPSVFAQRWASLVGYSVKVRCVSQGPGRFVVSVPVEVPNGRLQLVGGTRPRQ